MTLTDETFNLPVDITLRIYIVMCTFVPLFSLSRKCQKLINSDVLLVYKIVVSVF